MGRSLPDAVLRSAGPDAFAERQPEQPPRKTVHRSAAALAGVPLFAGLSKRHLRHLAKEADELTFEPGERIAEQGAPGETLFVVLSGTAKVTRNKRAIGAVVPGDFFGELSALDGGLRTATVTASTPVRVLRLFRHTLHGLVEAEPQVSLKILGGIVRRVREAQRRAG